MNEDKLNLWKEKTKGLFYILEWKSFWNYITYLQQENERLKQFLFKSANNTNKAMEQTEVYKSRCEKALHLIKHNDIYDYRVFEEKLKNILNGD